MDPIAIRVLGAPAVIFGPDQPPTSSRGFGLFESAARHTVGFMRRKLTTGPEAGKEIACDVAADF